MSVGRVAAALREEARAVDERRLLVLTGAADATRDAAVEGLDAADVDPASATYVGTATGTPWKRVAPKATAEVLGTTRDAVVVDCHDECRPNAIGRTVGAVDGGGLLLLLAPPLEEWPDRRDDFDASLAVPPFGVDDVAGNFRSRLVSLLRVHPGVAIVEIGPEAVGGTGETAATVVRDGRTDPAPRRPSDPPAIPDEHGFPADVYERCLTGDQITAVSALEALRDPGAVVVVEADRGRGKSSATGLAAGALALDGRDVLVTAATYRNAAEVFERAREVLESTVDLESNVDLDSNGDREAGDGEADPRRLETATGGLVRFERPAAAAELPGDPDAVIVDEAAALPVSVLERFLEAPAAAFVTTVHGYEGAGRGFSVRFRDRLDDADRAVTAVEMTDPIRYAAGDPVEVWAFRALGLDASPAVEPLVESASTDSVAYRRIDAADLLADEHLLREAFGLLVTAHYRTEPDDLARLLDAPNVSVRALTHDGHVVSVALLAREGDLPADLRAEMYEGARVRGNMIPDVLTSQLRDEAAGVPVGQRVLRIATHHAVRSRGLGSMLLAEVRDEFEDDVDWLGTGYGATPELLRFWKRNGYATVHLSTTRNDASGEYSAVMLRPTSDPGRALHRRHSRWFVDRIGSVLSDPLDDLDADVARATLGSADATPSLDLSDWEWRLVAGMPSGAGIFDTSPRPLRRLTVRYLADSGRSEPGVPDEASESVVAQESDGAKQSERFEGSADDEDSEEARSLSPREERLLVRKALQGAPWGVVADELDYHSRAECMRALGRAVGPLLSRYASPNVRDERRRFD